MLNKKGSSKPSEWYYSNQGQEIVGPCSQAQLKKLAAEGQIKPDDLVAKNRAVRLVKAASVKGLFPTH